MRGGQERGGAVTRGPFACAALSEPVVGPSRHPLLLTSPSTAAYRGCRAFVFAGCAALALALTVGFYCVVWVRRVQGSSWPWAIAAPGMVETATAAGCVSFLSFTVGLWPAYGLLTPLVVAVCFMGAAMTLHFLPAI